MTPNPLAHAVGRALHNGAAVALTLAVVKSSALAQQGTLDARLTGAPDGMVRLAFAARPGVCGDGDDISIHDGRSGHVGHSRSDDVEWADDCEDGPVRVVIEVRNHVPVRIRTHVGGQWRAPRTDTPPVTDLGIVSAPAAAGLLMSLAQRLPATPGSDAIMPATLADSATVWPALATLARDGARPSSTRRQAVFWLGQAAADVTPGLDSIAEDSSVDRDVREQAVFALSQRPHDEGVPALIQIATSHHDPEIRRKALFWLGQSGDPRAIDVFERILTDQR
jgi:hypothetical protein